MSARKTSSTAFSKMENTFIASSTLKRNKRYLDIEKINSEEAQEYVKRRQPRNNSKRVDSKINRSFSSSTAALTERLGRDISKFKQRYNSQQRPTTAHSFVSNSEAPTSQRSIKGVGIGQHLSRQQFYKVREKPVLDQRLFNNFKNQEPDAVHMADLGRGPLRDFDNSLKHITHLQYQTQNLYQDFYYKRTTMDCRFHYKKQKQEDRFYFIPMREQNKPATDLSPKAVKKAADNVQLKQPVDSFYMNSGRQLPCQFDQRTGTALTSHWRNEQQVIERPRPQYAVRALKERLYDERKQRISESKKTKLGRNQICDKKYFVIHSEA